MPDMKDLIEGLPAQQLEWTRAWHEAEPAAQGTGFVRLVAENHLRNFLLWHEEDIARRDDLGCEAVYRAKRAIDSYNQQRNDFIEKMDQELVAVWQPKESGCPFNSETPGMMLDRLSILALKDYHMEEQTLRTDVEDAHRQKCTVRLAVIRKQRQDLAAALAELADAVQAGTRSFRVYYQFKMYNDPTLNPQLYAALQQLSGGR